jgi:transcriptional regulator with XRE-family HTH domain
MVLSSTVLWDSTDMCAQNRYQKAELFTTQLATRLKVLRSERGLSQERVAFAAGISAYTYQKFEKGESRPGEPLNPRLSTLLALADAFEIDITELLDLNR